MSEPRPISDNELIYLVREKQDSNAANELINRHSGIYCAIAQKYSGYSDKIQIEEIKDDKEYNMYQWIIEYKPDKGMKLSTYIGEMTRYLCLDIMAKTPEQVEITEVNEPISVDNAAQVTSEQDSRILVRERALKVSDPRFWEIFELRNLGDKTLSWRKIGKILGMTGQGVLYIYNKHIHKVKHFITYNHNDKELRT